MKHCLTMIVSLVLLMACGSGGAQGNTQTAFPFKLYDTHAHFYTDDLDRFPLHAEKAYMGADKMKEIVLTRPSSRENVLALWAAHGVEAGVGVQYSAAYDTDNAYLLDVASREPARVHPVVIVALADTAAAELEEMVQAQGVVGVRMPISRDGQGRFPWLDTVAARKIWDVAERRQLAVVLFPPLRGEQSRATSDALAARVPDLAHRYPHVRIVLDHMGWPDVGNVPDFGLNELYRSLARPNVYLKLTTVNLMALKGRGIDPRSFVAKAVEFYGADHLLWGSDQGNTALPYAQMLALAHSAAEPLTPAQAKEVFRDTGMRVFSRR